MNLLYTSILLSLTFLAKYVSVQSHAPETEFYIFIFTIYMAPEDEQTSVSFCLFFFSLLGMTEQNNSISKTQIHSILGVYALFTLTSL